MRDHELLDAYFPGFYVYLKIEDALYGSGQGDQTENARDLLRCDYVRDQVHGLSSTDMREALRGYSFEDLDDDQRECLEEKLLWTAACTIRDRYFEDSECEAKDENRNLAESPLSQCRPIFLTT
jgi:hypothetical protein